MPTVLDAPATASSLTVMDEPSVVCRHPFYLSSGRDSLLAWLHVLESSIHFRHGVVICPPVGYEHLHTHRSLRHLADALARRSIPALRFDWSGHGDSSRSDDDPDRLACWLDNVRDAVEHLRHIVGCTHISVVGLRMGALLATTALADQEIENLVLWAPVFRGRDFVREMRAIDRLADAPCEPGGPSTDDIESAGFVLTTETATALNSVQLDSGQPHCHRVLMALCDTNPVDSRTSSWLDSSTPPADVIRLPGYVEMMAEPHRSQVPTVAIGEISDWLQQHIVEQVPCDLTIDHQRLTDLPVYLSHWETSAFSADTTPRQYVESICWISRSPDLFGIVTEPETVAEDRPTIVLLNAGSSYRIGPGRLSVLLARQFAIAGFRTIRIDLHGLGDSVTTLPGLENDPYPATTFRDVDLTLQHLRMMYGAHPQLLMGLCSGAYAAFQSAAQLDLPALVESVLINPLTFFWREGMTIDDDTTARELFRQTDYFQSARKLDKWWKLISGRSRIGLSGAMTLVARRISDLLPRRGERPPQSEQVRRTRSPSHPVERNLPGDLTQIAAANRHLTMFFASDDPGLKILMKDARATALHQQRTGQLEIHLIDHADHTFSRRFARQTLVRELVTHLASRTSRRI